MYMLSAGSHDMDICERIVRRSLMSLMRVGSEKNSRDERREQMRMYLRAHR